MPLTVETKDLQTLINLVADAVEINGRMGNIADDVADSDLTTTIEMQKEALDKLKAFGIAKIQEAGLSYVKEGQPLEYAEDVVIIPNSIGCVC